MRIVFATFADLAKLIRGIAASLRAALPACSAHASRRLQSSRDRRNGLGLLSLIVIVNPEAIPRLAVDELV